MLIYTCKYCGSQLLLHQHNYAQLCKYKWTLLNAVFLSANSSICNCKLTIFLEQIPEFIVILGLPIWDSLYASQFFWSLSIAYNEVHLYTQLEFMLNFYAALFTLSTCEFRINLLMQKLSMEH